MSLCAGPGRGGWAGSPASKNLLLHARGILGAPDQLLPHSRLPILLRRRAAGRFVHQLLTPCCRSLGRRNGVASIGVGFRAESIMTRR